MLDGSTFGDAVLAARQTTHQQHPYANTWGAYQCYGDPDFFLIETPPTRRGRPETPASLEQLINRIDELRAEIDCAGDADLAALLKRLEDWRSMVEDDIAWSRSGRAWAALARVYNAAFQFEGAIGCYQRAFAQEDGGLTMQDMEQWTNCECRIAVNDWRAQSAKTVSRSRRGRSSAEPPEFLARISAAIARLDRLNPDVEALTNERLSVLGSAYKRLAWMKPGERLDALRQARDRYRRAATSKDGTNYALVNWGALDLVLSWRQRTPAAPSETPSDLDQRLVSARAALKARIEREPVLWDLVAYADLTLLLRLRSGPILVGPDTIREEKELIDNYCEVRRLANAREDATVVEQLEFLSDMAEQFKPDDGEVLAMLNRLRHCILARSDGAPAPSMPVAPAAARKPAAAVSSPKRKSAKRPKAARKRAKKSSARKKASPR
jgi:tetratricopeptide (TPR) repeat protein